MILEFTKRTVRPGVTALVINGSIHSGPECVRLEDAVTSLIAAGDICVIFDMTAVTHADSAAMGSIVRCLVRLKSAGGALRIAAAQSMIEHSLRLTKLDRILDLFPTVEQAARGFSSSDASAFRHG